MSDTEHLLVIEELDAATADIKRLGGHVRHVLTPQLLVAFFADAAAVPKLKKAQPVDLAALRGLDRSVAKAWIKQHQPEKPEKPELATRSAAGARRKSAVVAWDTPGFLPPLLQRPKPRKSQRGGSTSESTNTPTSVVLRGSVAVGIVMVSGPASLPWSSVTGALKQVSVAADQSIWGVNASNAVFRRDGGAWKRMPGALVQVSVGHAALVWGVNAAASVFRWNGTAWDLMPGKLKHVSVAADGTVWGVNAADKIFRWNGTGWDPIPGALKQVAVGSVNLIWGVNAADKIFRWNGAGWTAIAGALKFVAVASDGAVWGVNAQDQIFRRNGTLWQPVPGALKQVSVGSTAQVWGVNAADAIFFQPGAGFEFSAAEKSTLMAEVMEGLSFLASAEPEAQVSFVYDWQDITVDVAVGNGSSYEDFEKPWRNAALRAMGFAASRQGSLAYVNALRLTRHTDWAYVAYFTKYPLKHFAYAGDERLVMHYDNDGWGPAQINKVFAHETCHIFGAADEYGECSCDDSGHNPTPNFNCKNCTPLQLDCLMNGNTLSLCGWSRGQIGWSIWQQVAGALVQVAVAADGTVWGVNAANQIFRRDGAAWTRMPGALKQVSVGAQNAVWGVNSTDAVFRWNGAAWDKMPGKLKYVAVAADGAVWGVNAADAIFRWGGAAWIGVSGALKQIAVKNSSAAAGSVWGVNAADKIFQWNGSGWTQVAGALKHVAVAADGTLWGVNAADKIFKRDGATWAPAPGALQQIAVGSSGQVWGTNAGANVYRLK